MMVSNTIIGSGFVFGKQKDVVTCAHVVPFNGDLTFSSGKPMRHLRLKYILPRYDLAVFSAAPEIEGEAFKIGDFKRIRPGDQIVYCGWDSRTNSIMVNLGVITAMGSAMNDGRIIEFLEFEGIGIPGYSGGAVFNHRGELVAIMREAWMKRPIKGGPEILINRAFSLEILDILDGQVFAGIISAPGNTNKSGMSLLDLIEKPRLKEPQ
jgi:S1-C subfamily serine protease